MKLISGLILSCVSALVIVGCGSDSKKKGGGAPAPFGLTDEGVLPETAEGTGCIQGVLLNAKTGERISIGRGEGSPGLYAQVQSRRYFATPVGDQNEPKLRGEYFICNIPLDENIPVIGLVNGFVPSESSVKIESKLVYKSSDDSEKAAIELADKTRPMAVLNLAMHPFALDSEPSATVMVTNLGSPVAKATVRMQLVGLPRSQFAITAPDLKRAPVLTVESDANGNAVFPANQLVRGGTYNLSAEMQTTGSVLRPTNVSFVYGNNEVSTANQRDGQTAFIELSTIRADLQLISSNIQTGELNAAGSAVYLFNRDIELMPGTEDSLSASLSGNTLARLKADVSGNGVAESVSVSIEGNRLVISPNFERSPDARVDAKLKVVFKKIVVRAKNVSSTVSREIPAAEVTMFDQQPVLRIVKKFSVDARIPEGVRVNDSYNVVVNVRDQFDYAMSGVSITCTTNDAALDPALVLVRVTTNDDGLATCQMRVGTASGKKTLRVTVDSTAETSLREFVARPGLASKVSIDTASTSQSAVIGTPLPKPISIKVADQFGNFVSGTSVRFEILNAAFGSVSQALVLTNDAGVAETVWTLGTFLGVQELTARVDGVGDTKVAATGIKAPTL